MISKYLVLDFSYISLMPPVHTVWCQKIVGRQVGGPIQPLGHDVVTHIGKLFICLKFKNYTLFSMVILVISCIIFDS